MSKINIPITYFSFRCQRDPTLGFFPLNATSFGFRYQTFKFVHYDQVYIHCRAFVCLLSEKNEECDRSCNSTLHSTPRPLTRDRRQAITRTSYSREIYHILSPEIFIFKKTGDNSGDREIDIPNGTFHLELLWPLLLFIYNIRCHHDVWIIHWAPFIYFWI